jgi:hypothetical protein
MFILNTVCFRNEYLYNFAVVVNDYESVLRFLIIALLTHWILPIWVIKIFFRFLIYYIIYFILFISMPVNLILGSHMNNFLNT